MIKNKKAGVIYPFLLLALLILVGYGLYLSFIVIKGVNYPGESSQNLLNSIESANRLSLYIDISIDQSIKKSIQDLAEDAAFLIEKSANYQTPLPCGEAIFPLLNNQSKQVECFPEYKQTLIRNFERAFQRKIANYPQPILINTEFKTQITETQNDLILKILSSPVSIPVQGHIGAYYQPITTQQTTQTVPSNKFTLQEETGYYLRSGLKSNPRINPPDSIVIHYTRGHRVEHAYDTLAGSIHSYHYIIEKNGTIYNFVDELRAAVHAGCAEAFKLGYPCQEGYNSRSIGISLVNLGDIATQNCEVKEDYFGMINKCWERYPEIQMQKLVELTADIVERQAQQGNLMKINTETIKTHQEIDPKRKWDPGPLFNKEEYIDKVKQELQKRGYEHEV